MDHRFTGLYESKFHCTNAQWIWPPPRCIFAWVAGGDLPEISLVSVGLFSEGESEAEEFA